ncbi:phospholipase D-like protein [Hydrogenispora ethanolica]|uniref:Phospholipase D-like protein n=1 Tax=Hydrogenispora ethanolica TaxID=1082276 RepID=A0A4R1RCZ6_HYDET|nr:phospholipase D-like domain-containing protein [Hydrogenispora ethanolica]TCL63362.1 phospholipase D-like protein [Hydrogenispora ethanolica]
MSRIAFGAILLSTNEWTQACFAEGTIVTPAQCSSYRVTIPDGKPLEYAIFEYTLPADSRAHQFSIKDYLVNVVQTANSRIVLTSPVRYFNTLDPNEKKFQLPGLLANFRSIYIHSKLALVDDSYAQVGSANFTTRSLSWDGECSVGINSSAKAKEIRETIFQHWGVDTPLNWQAKMNDFAQHPVEGVGVVPLPINVLSTTPPSWVMDYITAVIDPSDLY